MKTEEDEAFDDLAKKQGSWGGGYQAKRKAAADKLQEDVLNYGTAWSQDGKRIDPTSVYKEPVTEREALKLALEALENVESAVYITSEQEAVALEKVNQAIPAIKEALAQPPLPVQPTPVQEPVAWKTMEAKYPSLEKLDIRMGDGSILCDVWPQSDGDLWWEGSGTGEKFIDPKYADVTHWRVHSDTTAPQRTWIWLSDADIADVIDTTCQYTGGYEEYLIKKAERKIRSMNT